MSARSPAMRSRSGSVTGSGAESDVDAAGDSSAVWGRSSGSGPGRSMSRNLLPLVCRAPWVRLLFGRGEGDDEVSSWASAVARPSDRDPDAGAVAHRDLGVRAVS